MSSEYCILEGGGFQEDSQEQVMVGQSSGGLAGVKGGERGMGQGPGAK